VFGITAFDAPTIAIASMGLALIALDAAMLAA
jgi:hypothetical protein